MLNGFGDDLNGVDFTLPPEELKVKLAELANTRAAGLTTKNDELINKNKQINELLSTKGELTAAEKEQLKELQEFKSNTDLSAAEEAKKYEDAKTLYQQNHQISLDSINEANKKALEESNGKADSYESQLKEIKVDQAITNELVKLEVSKELLDMAHASIAQQAKFVDGKAMIGEKSLSDFMTEWAVSPAGKAARLAPNNSGGGSNGSGNNNTSNNSNKVLNTNERAAKIKEKFK